MKKIVPLALALILTLSLSSCSDRKPDTVVVSFCNAIKSFDFDAAAVCMEDSSDTLVAPYDDSEIEENLSSEQVLTYLKDCASQVTYKIGESNTDGDTASIPVTFSYVDTSPVITSTLSEYITQAFALAFSGADDTQIEELFGNILMEKMESVETGTASADVTFNCVKVNDDWKISSFTDEDEITITNIMTSNFIKVFEDFDEESNDNSDEVPKNTVWHNVPLGQEVELATLKICITGCEEKSELTGEYIEPTVALEGTKYVIFSVSIENITKDIINFNNDLKLTDSQGRNYVPDTDALWYFDETFNYTDLAPNITKSGVFVYNVPLDSSDYYLSVLKAGSDDGYRLYSK